MNLSPSSLWSNIVQVWNLNLNVMCCLFASVQSIIYKLINSFLAISSRRHIVSCKCLDCRLPVLLNLSILMNVLTAVSGQPNCGAMMQCTVEAFEFYPFDLF